jgi:hypothetical protein
MKSLMKKASEAVNGILAQTHMQIKQYVSADHTQIITIMFPEGLVPPGSITMEPGQPGDPPVVFWYNPEMPDRTESSY